MNYLIICQVTNYSINYDVYSLFCMSSSMYKIIPKYSLRKENVVSLNKPYIL